MRIEILSSDKKDVSLQLQPELLEIAAESGAKYLAMELDQTYNRAPLQAVEISCKYLQLLDQ